MPSPGGSTVPKESGVKGMLLRDRGEGGKEARGRWAQAEVRERWKEKKANSHTLHSHSSYSMTAKLLGAVSTGRLRKRTLDRFTNCRPEVTSLGHIPRV